MTEQGKQVFVRQSTGLVRSLSFFDQFIVSQSIIIFLNSFVLTALFAPFFFPGANLIIVFALGAVPAFAMAAVYSILSAALPRSGGDYVWSTRILGPFYGSIQFVFLFVTSVIGGLGLPTYYAITIALSQLSFSLGATLNNSSLINLASSFSSPGLGFPISLVIIAVGTLIALFGLRPFAWFQRISMMIFFAVTALFVIMLVITSPSSIQSSFNHAMLISGSNTTYSGIIQQASSSGYSGGFNLTNTLLAAIPWGFLAFTGFNYGSYLAGETKNVKSSMTKALFLSVIVTTIFLVLMSVLAYNDFGTTFLNAASYVQATNPSVLPTMPTATLLISLTNSVAAGIIGFGLFLGFVVVSISYIATIARMFFAASFDRLIPSKFANVSDRFHSPYLSVIFIGVVWVLFTAVLWFGGFVASLLNTSLVAPIGYILPLIAALLFYSRKRELFVRSVQSVARPATLIIASIVGIGAFALYIFAETFPIISGMFLGASLALAYEVVGAVLVIGIALYAIAKFRMRSLGLELSAIYEELPPE